MNFNDLQLSKPILKAITDLGFEKPSEIQEKAIPVMLAEDADFIGQAQTGTGKTAAFTIPLLEKLDLESNHIQALILCPTRELANQVCEEVAKLGKYLDVKTASVYGGQDIEKQISLIKRKKPQIIVGTPGRVMDLKRRKVLNFKQADYLILDEADEMLNMGFLEDIQEVLSWLKPERRVWMFSATMPGPILKMIQKDFQNPIEIKVKKKTITKASIEQQSYVVKGKHKLEALRRIILINPDMYGLIFCRTRMDTVKVAEYLNDSGFSVEVLNGDMSQAHRDRAMENFKNQKVNIMVCTDVAARGIDVNNLTHVINYGLPQDNESYVHRIGRTGRAGQTGVAINLVDAQGARGLRNIERLLKVEIKKQQLPSIEVLKRARTQNEVARMGGVISSIKEKGDSFKLDASYDDFRAGLHDLSREQVLRVFFTTQFNKEFRRLNDLGDIEEVKVGPDRSRGARRSRKRNGRAAARGRNNGSRSGFRSRA